MRNPVPLLRSIAIVEGISFLILLGIAMPLKYYARMPLAVTWFGWAHGVLFVLFGFVLLQTMIVAKWSIIRAATVFISALLPFGPFILDRRMREYGDEFDAAQRAPSPSNSRS